MSTTWPSRRAIIPGTSARVRATGARRLTSSMRSISSCSSSTSQPEAGSAALATSTSISPASATNRSSSDRWARSHTTARARSRRASGSSTSARRPLSTRLAPCAANASAIAPPRPPVAPVISTLPSSNATAPVYGRPWSTARAGTRPRPKAPAAAPGRRGMRAGLPGHTARVARAAVIAIFGPTGVGKTEVALAQRLRELGERPVAVSADALQVYQGLERLTGAATAAERARLEHRLISLIPIDATFSAGHYAELAHAEIDELLAGGHRPLVVGGTGLYLRAALTELSLSPPPPEGARERWLAELERRGPQALHAELARRAPWAAAEIAPGDRQRIVRALELLEAGELEPPSGQSELWTDTVRHPTLLAGLVMERAALYARIEARVERMVAAGAQDEVRRAAAAGAF